MILQTKVLRIHFSDMENIWTVIRKKGDCWPHVTESEFHEVGDNIRRDLWAFIRDHPNVPLPFIKAANLYQKLVQPRTDHMKSSILIGPLLSLKSFSDLRNLLGER